MVGICYLCSVWGEPLAQTAQSFMPAFIHGSDRNLKQARSLLGVLMLMGVIVGFAVGCMAISVPWFFPYIFTKDPAIIAKVESLPKGINFSLFEGSLYLEVLVSTILLGAELGDF
jgi:Na+-driven multidrug efflux pump